eukprot:jgi/Tetstr1/428175/TSEL_018226.t1
MEANTAIHPPLSAKAFQPRATVFSMAFSSVVYLYFLWVFCAAICFVGSITATSAPQLPPLVIQMFPFNLDGNQRKAPVSEVSDIWTLFLNALPLSAFALQHAIMARGSFKKLVTSSLYPVAVERSVFVLASSAILHALFHVWTPLPSVLWSFPESLHRVVWAFQGFGWLLVLAATFMIDHFDLFGVKPGFGIASNLAGATFATPWLYKYIRHPIMAGFLIAFWSAPVMTVGRLFFSAVVTTWVLLDVKFLEEADLKHHFPEYSQYCDQVGAYIPNVTFTSSCPFASFKAYSAPATMAKTKTISPDKEE